MNSLDFGENKIMSSFHKKESLEKEIQEKRILEAELKQMKKGGSVYKQQPNSNIFFKEDTLKVFTESKRSLDELVEEYKQCEFRIVRGNIWREGGGGIERGKEE